MKRLSLMIVLLAGFVLMGAQSGCSSDPNVEGAKLDLRNKDYDRALENVNTALERNPENAEAHYLKGQILQEQLTSVQDLDEHRQMVEDLVSSYNRARELDPSLSDDISNRLRLAYYNEFQKGYQNYQRGQENPELYVTAYEYFKNAAFIQPDSIDAVSNQAYTLLNAGRYPEAITAFERTIEMGDTRPDNYVLLQDLYLNQGRAEDAVALLESAREAYPDNEEIQDRLLNAYIAANQIDRAMDVYREAVERDPENKLYRYNYGSLLLNANRYDDAIEHLSAAVRIDPEYASAHYNLGAAYVNKAVDVTDEINRLDDELRANQDWTDAQEEAQEAQIEELRERRREMFAQAVPPLEKAKAQMEAAGEQGSVDLMSVCKALFSAYVQTGKTEEAQTIQECAGFSE